MTKVLNLDAIETASEKVINYKGLSHVYKPLTVAEFIVMMKDAEDRDKEGPQPLSESVEYMVQTILRAFPTFPEADLRALPADRLKVINDFTNSTNKADVEDATQGEAAGESN